MRKWSSVTGKAIASVIGGIDVRVGVKVEGQCRLKLTAF